MIAKRTLVVLAVCLAMVSMVATAEAAYMEHGFSCKDCHYNNLSSGSVTSNLCISCHGSEGKTVNTYSGMVTLHGDIAPQDASDHYGNNPLNPAPGVGQRSHNWSASDNNSAAGTAPPNSNDYPEFYYDPVVGKAVVSGKLTCSRCHAPHGMEGSPSLLRYGANLTNPEDFCRACHVDFDLGAAAYANPTHPLVTYDPSYVGTGKFKAFDPPADSGGADVMTLDGGPNGTLTCTTCHGMHYVDSNTSTPDGAMNSATLAGSDGLLLRGNGTTVTGADNTETANLRSDMCQSCHVYQIHGDSDGSGNGEMLGCVDCHSAHSPSNYFGLKSTVNTATFGMKTGVSYANVPTTHTGGWANVDDVWGGVAAGVEDGYCEGCHGNLESWSSRTHSPDENCAACHSHDRNSFEGACTDCHGYPPVDNAGGGPDATGYAIDPTFGYDYSSEAFYKPELATPHKTHAASAGANDYGFSCSECHKGNLHNDGPANATFQDVFIDTSGQVSGIELAASYTNPAGVGNCTTYCHSNGLTRGAATPTAGNTVQWQNGRDDIIVDAGAGRCQFCHGNDKASMGTKNNSSTHDVHLDNGFACNVCHVNTATDEDTLVATAIRSGNNRGIHVDGTVNVGFDTTDGLKGTANTIGSRVGSVAYASASATCNVYCHSSGRSSGLADADYADVTWTSTISDCTSCHDVPGGSNQTAAHAAHVNGASSDVGRNLDCSVCHNDTATNATTLKAGASGPAGTHVNGEVDIHVVLPPSTDAADCTNVYCHTDGNYDGTVTNKYPAGGWAGTVSDCSSCHGDGAGNPEPSYSDGNVGTGASNSHGAHVGGGIACAECHAETIATTSDDAIDGSAPQKHVNNVVEVSGAKIDTWTPASETCSAAACHGAGTPQWGGSVVCGSCHSANNTLGGSHSSHYDDNATGDYTIESVASTTTNYVIQCGVCHSPNGGSAISHAGGWVDTDTPDRQTAEVNFDGTVASGTFTAGASETLDNGFYFTNSTCANLYCHGNFSGNGNNATPVWGGGAPCGSCHDVASTFSGGQHELHVGTIGLDCDYCHGGTAVGGIGNIDDKSTHVNTQVEVELDASKNVFTASSTYNGVNSGAIPQGAVGGPYDTCASIYCHSDVQPDGGTGGPTSYYNTANWASTETITCGDCHNAGPFQTTGSHTKHFSDYGIGCGVCHAGGGSGANHGDYEVDVSIIPGWGGTYNYNVGSTIAPGDAYTDCSNVLCHSDGQATPTYQTVLWGSTISDCTSCHEGASAGTGLSGKHEEHIVNAGTTIGRDLTCNVCHPVTASSNSAIATNAQHVVDNEVDVIDCSTNVCHSDGNFGADLVQHNPNFVSDALGCDDCHGDGAGKSHPVYANGGAADDSSNSHVDHVENSSISCDECHNLTSTAGTSINGTTPTEHVDGGIDVSFKQGGSYVDGTDTCSTTYCHGAGTPVWGGAALNCNSCHRANNTLPNSHGAHYESSTAASDINSGNSSIAGEYIFQCGNCHNATAHAGGEAVTGIRAAEVSLAGSGSYTPDGATAATDAQGFKYTSGTCGTNDCHNDGTGGAPNTATVEWSVDTLTCTGCHNSNVASGSAMATNAHGAHLTTSYGSSKTCQTCHDDTLNASDTAIADKRKHVNQIVNVAILPAVDGGNSWSAGSCDAVYCHSPGQDSDGTPLTAGSYVTATWATASTGDCGTCHAISEGGGLTSGSHGEHLGTAGVNGCGDCHTGAANNGSAYNSAEHVDGGMDVAGTYNAAVSMGDGYGTCSAASCHDDGTGSPAETPRWGTSGGCASCHADDMTNASHGDHLTTTITTAITISCDNCHGNAVKSTTAITDGLGAHLDDNVDVYNSAIGDLGYAAVNPLGANYQTCSTTYCHGDTLKFSNEDDADNVDNVDTSPTWGANLSGAGNGCDYCHGYPPVGDTGSGAQHPTSADCSACHFKVEPTNDLSFTDASEHIDGIVQVDGGNNCTDCHGSGKYKDPNTAHPDHADHTDVYTFLAGKTLPDGDYGKEAEGWYTVSYDASGNIVAGCGQCHPQAQASHPSGGATEIDLDPAGETILAANNAKKLNSSPSYSAGKCSNVYCHSDGNGTFTPVGSLPAWGGPAENLTCGDCHGNSPTSDAHDVHVVGIHYEDLYDDDGDGLMPSSGSSGAAHGDDITSDPINCQTCHNNTVTVESNDSNSTCVTCHDGSPIALQGESAIKASSSSHLNGAKDVIFTDMATFKSKAQLRDDIESVTEVGTYWDRNTYKDSGGGSFDTGAGTATWAAGTCSAIACHNGNTAVWTDSNVDCMYCHTSLPQ